MKQQSTPGPRPTPARMIIADDHELARAGLRTMLEGDRGLTLVGEATNGREAVALCQELRPDLALLDVRMPEMDGLASARAIRQTCPQTRVLIMTTHENPDYLLAALKLVLNATFERGGLARKDIEATLKRPIAMTLPYMPEPLVSAINRGVPPVLDLAHKPVGAMFEDFALFVSKDEHRTNRPARPTEAWQRLAQRQQRRRAS